MGRFLNFQTCDTCAVAYSANPADAYLCVGCDHNRRVISAFDQATMTSGSGRLAVWHEAARILNGATADVHRIPIGTGDGSGDLSGIVTGVFDPDQ